MSQVNSKTIPMPHNYDLYYDHPVQIRFWREGRYVGGFAIHDFIIDGERGALYLTKEVISLGVQGGVYWDDVIIELDWLNLSEEIMGN